MEKTLCKINNQSIVIFEENGEKTVPIRPICQALGIAFQSQNDKIKNDEILSSVVTLKESIGADGKKHEMSCLPMKYIFGWIFTINPKNVSQEAAKTVVAYKKECYDAFFYYFTARVVAFEKYSHNVVEMSKIYTDALYDSETARIRLAEIKSQLVELQNKDIHEAIIEEMSKLPFETE